MKAATLTDLAAVEALVPAWRELWRRALEATPFQSPDWLLPWWRAFAPGELSVIAASEGERLIGLAPFYLEPGTRRLLPVGISLSDYCDVLLDPDRRDTTAALVVDQACSDPRWREWEFPELRPSAAVHGLPVPAGCREEIGGGQATLRLSLPATFSRRKRARIRDARNRAKRRGEVTYLRAGPGHVEPLLDEVLRLHGERWTERGVPGGVLGDRRVAEFLKAAVPLLDADGVARLHGVCIGGRVAAAMLEFVHRGRVYAYMSGFDPEFAFESPGVMIFAHVIEQAAEEGAEEVDFLRGEETYKFSWGCERVESRRRVFRRAAADARA